MFALKSNSVLDPNAFITMLFINFQDDRHLALPSYIFVVDLSEKNYEVELPCCASHARIHERHGKKSFDSVINLT